MPGLSTRRMPCWTTRCVPLVQPVDVSRRATYATIPIIDNLRRISLWMVTVPIQSEGIIARGVGLALPQALSQIVTLDPGRDGIRGR